MSVRLRRSGVTDIKDHNELINRGKRTHAEIDTYLSEIDGARDKYKSLGERFKEIETKNIIQDNRLSAIENLDITQEKRITDLETTSKSHSSQLLALGKGQLVQDGRLDDLEAALGNGGGGGNPQEVIDARTDKNGITYGTLKERLDAQQGAGGGGTVTATASGYLFQVVKNTVPNLKTVVVDAPYAVGQNEIEVFRGGVRQIKDVHYIETNKLTVTFSKSLYVNEIVIIRRRDRDGANAPLHLTSEYVIIQGKKTKYPVVESYNSPYKSLEVYYNGVLLLPDEDYLANLENSVTLKFEPLQGALLLFQVVDKKKLPKQFLLEEHQDISVGKTIYTLNTFTFSDSELEVYVQGVRWYEGFDYVEIDNKTVKFTNPLPPNGQVSFIKESNLKLAEEKDLNQVEKRVTKLENTSSSTGGAVNQFEVNDVIATNTNPSVQLIKIPSDASFKSIPLNILTFKDGQQGVSETVSDFTDATKFTAASDVVFNGKMQLKTSSVSEMTLHSDLGDGNYILTQTIDRSLYKKINSLAVV